MNRATIERLLAQAQQTQAQVEKHFGTDGARKNPVWRNANAQRRQLVRRLNAVASLETRDSSLKAKKAESVAE